MEISFGFRLFSTISFEYSVHPIEEGYGRKKLYICIFSPNTEKNLAKIFLIYHKIWNISGAKLIYEEGEKDFLCHEERSKIFVIY